MARADELVKLGESNLTVEDPAEDIRNRDVLDRDGEKIGTVDGLYLDPDERRVRFMEVASGGFLGIGEQHVLIPVDAITRIDQDHVHINQSRQFIASGPTYDPKLVKDTAYWSNLYSYYGFSPYWAPGYFYPPYPFFPESDAELDRDAGTGA